jgi:hypothetical protein
LPAPFVAAAFADVFFVLGVAGAFALLVAFGWGLTFLTSSAMEVSSLGGIIAFHEIVRSFSFVQRHRALGGRDDGATKAGIHIFREMLKGH